MRYCYHNKLYIASGAGHGVFCDPIKRPDGKCVLGKRHQLVLFEDGERHFVIRRCVRLKNKCKIHSKGDL